METQHWSEIKSRAYEARIAGEYKRAETLYLEALSQALPLAETDHNVSILYNTIAAFYREQADMQNAERFAREGIQLDRRTRPINARLLANDLMFLALVLGQQGKYEEAICNAEEGVSIYEIELGKNDIHVEAHRQMLDQLRLNLMK